MKINLTLLILVLCQLSYAQEYDNLIIEKDNVDADNEIYETGSVFVYDYDIIKNGAHKKLKSNRGMFAGRAFELASPEADSILVDKLHMLVMPIVNSERSNENQTQIAYLQEPQFESIHSTGAVENSHNVWLHPIRYGFFASLETAPFPYVTKPLQISTTWTDEVKIGQGWGDPLWGTWEGGLLLQCSYTVSGKQTLKTNLGSIDCYVIKSTAQSTIGTTTLTSYFSEKYGFVRLEYTLLNDLKVNMWLVDVKSNQEFNDARTFGQTKKYIKQ